VATLLVFGIIALRVWPWVAKGFLDPDDTPGPSGT
jgi:hypothetical protein